MNMKRFAVPSPRPCRTVAPLLVPYAENTLPASARARVRQHLDGCPLCRAEVETLARMTAVLREATPPTPVLDTQLWSRLEREISAPAPWYRGPLAPVWGAVAMASVVGLGFVALRPAQPTGANSVLAAQAKPVKQPAMARSLAPALAEAARIIPAQKARLDPFVPVVAAKPLVVVAKVKAYPATPRRVQVASLRVRRRHVIPATPVLVAAQPLPQPAPTPAAAVSVASVPVADTVAPNVRSASATSVMVAYANPSDAAEATLVRDSPPAVSMAEVGGADRRRSALFSYTAR